MKISFATTKELLNVIPNPEKANRHLPEYFKKLPPYFDNRPQSGTVKKCIPFLEAASAGYIIPMWCDVHVSARNGEINFDFPPYLKMESSMSTHPSVQVQGHPLEDKPYGNTPFKWHNPWIVSTQKGYSCMFTSPMNHLETRFKILDGIVDTDTYYNEINFPFVWTGGDGDFLIKKGTPLVQVIPFKRMEFKHEYGIIDKDRKTNTESKLGTMLKDAYRTMFWNKRK